MNSRRQRFYHPELDILRFTAFSMVFTYHALPKSPTSWVKWHVPVALAPLVAGIVQGGSYGVDLFFALSAYLITELLLREYRDRGTIDIRAFYIRRILRIWPLYFVIVIFSPPLLHFLDPQQYFSTAHLLGFLLFAGNWVCASRGWSQSAINPLWSVSIEEQFYLTWPLVVRYCPRYLSSICAGLFAVAIATRFVLVSGQAGDLRIWCDTLARLDPIAAGSLLAILLRGREVDLRVARRVAITGVGFSLIVLAGSRGGWSGETALWTYPTVTVGCILMIVGTLRPTGGSSGGYSRLKGSLVYLGRISYGLYVFHVAAIHFILKPSNSAVGWSLHVAESIAATICIAMLSYKYLETPFLKMKQRFTYVSSQPELTP